MRLLPMKTITSILIASALICNVHGDRLSEEDMHNYKPPDGYVPDQATAVRVAEAILIPIYGSDNVKRQLPLRATLTNGVWRVDGTAKTRFGGTASVEISKETGCILRVTHSK